MKVFEKENPSAAEWMERISFFKKKNQPFGSSGPSVKYKNFSDYVSNIEQKGEGADERCSPLNRLVPFPTRRVYDYGFRAFSVLCFIKDGIHARAHPSALSLIFHSGAKRERIRRASGWLSTPGRQLGADAEAKRLTRSQAPPHFPEFLFASKFHSVMREAGC